MPAIKENLWIEKGASWTQTFGLVFDGETVTPSWTVESHVRASEESTKILHAWSTAAANATIEMITHEGAEIPALTLTVSPEVSSAWAWCKGVYDLKITSPTGRAIRVLTGRVTVDPAVTR